MHPLASKWNLPASLHLPGDSRKAAADLYLEGGLAELIKTAVETLPQPLCRAVHIQCGDTILGHEAIQHAYRSADFPLVREKATPR